MPMLLDCQKVFLSSLCVREYTQASVVTHTNMCSDLIIYTHTR